MHPGKTVYRQEQLDGGWPIIHVLQGTAIIGRITRNPRTGTDRFFPGQDNSLAFQYEHRDLDALKQLIESRTPWPQEATRRPG